MTDPPPVGVVLAGGAGRRIGGDKAVVEVLGRPLLHYPVAAVREALGTEVAVVAKRDTALPPLPPGVRVWIEPDRPQHPLVGVTHALRLAGGRPVLVVAGDLPLITAAVVRALAQEPRAGAAAVVARSAGRVHPLCAVYLPAALPLLRDAAGEERVEDVVGRLGARFVDFPAQDDEAFHNVNAPEDVLHAAAALAARGG